MEDKKKGMLDVLAADEIHRYMKAKRAVNEDTELSEMVKEYEEGNKRLAKLIETEGFDADEAVRLSNDMDYIGFLLSQNPKILELQAANKAMNEYLAAAKGTVTFSCGGDCSSCAEACAAKPEQKDGEA
ncbi:MAG: YlbF family regulator [Clostridia bacterium]|nr:YlbF family regulator [Clostridia bacterium]MBQ6866334.1 YlbF family regulator [Clostridia bacterium]MBQ9323872.1 YlbF family regulator [Clostridia bacterium]MBR0421419.1 YlbF family regulator [Clostridia bacterium]